jgi:hypothetical protein
MTLDKIVELFDLLDDSVTVVRVIDAETEVEFIREIINKMETLGRSVQFCNFIVAYFELPNAESLYKFTADDFVDLLKQLFRNEEYYKFRNFLRSK